MMGVCGDNCEFCPRCNATRSGERTELEKVKELWVRLGLRDRDFPVENMACRGCLPESKCAYPGLRACAVVKGHDNCGRCDVFPCRLIEEVFMKTDQLKSRAIAVCTPEEMEQLRKAFFNKKKNLDGLHRINRQIEYRSPTVPEYIRLRNSVGWWEADEKAVERALKNSLFSVVLLEGSNVVGFGRIVGDDGLYYYLQDLIVHPEFQGKGLGRLLMKELMNYIGIKAGKGAFIGLMAANGLEKYYESFGFKARKHSAPGMYQVIE